MNIDDELRRELKFAPFIEEVLNTHIHLLAQHGFKMFEIEKASLKQDTEQGFDFWFTGAGLKIPVRVRTPDCKWRDFTIRWRAMFGGKTEIDKLSEGAGDIYFYAWTSERDIICDWILINLRLLREKFDLSRNNTTLINRVRSNGDGTYHTQVQLNELSDSIIVGTPKMMKKANQMPRLPIIRQGKQLPLKFGNH